MFTVKIVGRRGLNRICQAHESVKIVSYLITPLFRRRNQKLYLTAWRCLLIFVALAPARLQVEADERVTQRTLHSM
jgi:hypothetical protein